MIAGYIDHTVLKADTSIADVHRICLEARQYSFAAVCVPPYFVRHAKSLLADTSVKTATVIGFPFGYGSITAKHAEIKEAIAQGADELDMVINIAALKSGDWQYLEEEIDNCIAPIKEAGKVFKVIVESGILTPQELARCCDLYGSRPIDFMKTSTGYAAAGADVAAVQTMRRLLPGSVAIKASGGIRTFAFAKQLLDAGAARLGCSAGIQIVSEEIDG